RTRSQTGSESMSTPSMSNTTASITQPPHRSSVGRKPEPHRPGRTARAAPPRLRDGQDLVAVLGYQDGVLELGGALAVLGYRRPAVWPDVVVDRAQGQHRLDGERHAG